MREAGVISVPGRGVRKKKKALMYFSTHPHCCRPGRVRELEPRCIPARAGMCLPNAGAEGRGGFRAGGAGTYHLYGAVNDDGCLRGNLKEELSPCWKSPCGPSDTGWAPCMCGSGRIEVWDV